jgi:hypothetical protein
MNIYGIKIRIRGTTRGRNEEIGLEGKNERTREAPGNEFHPHCEKGLRQVVPKSCLLAPLLAREKSESILVLVQVLVVVLTQA